MTYKKYFASVFTRFVDIFSNIKSRQGWKQTDRLVFTLLLVYLVIAGLNYLGLGIPIAQPAIAFVLFAFVPGVLFIQIFEPTKVFDFSLAPYYIGISIFLLTTLGSIMNIISLFVGFERPLSFAPLVILFTALIAGMTALVRSRYPNPTVDFSPLHSLEWKDPFRLLCLQIPLLSIIGITLWNTVRIQVVLIAVFALISIIPILVSTRVIDKGHYPITILTVSLAVLHQKSLWHGFIWHGHGAVVSIWENEIWTFTGETLAINAIFVPSFAKLSGIHILTQLKVGLPFFVIFIPLGMYYIFKSYTGPTTGFLGTCLFIFAHPFYLQYPATPRASFPVFFIVLIGLLISDTNLSYTLKRLLVLMFSIGVIVSHYGTSYYLLFAMIIGVAVLPFFRVVDLRERGGFKLHSAVGFRKNVAESTNILGAQLVVFYSVAILAWYLYVDHGSKFYSLLGIIQEAYISLFLESGGRGSTTTRLATDYGAQSIEYSKYLYFISAVLLIIGLAAVSIRRILPKYDTTFNDEYIVLSSALFVLFGGTIAVSGAWGGGRPMMIVFSLTAIFAVVGTRFLGQFVRRVINVVSATVGSSGEQTLSNPLSKRNSHATFAIILLCLFITNTGVASVIIWNEDRSPNNVLTADQVLANQETDIQTHAWLTDHRDPNADIYGDRLARAQATDWAVGEIIARSEGEPYRFTQQYFFHALNDSDVEPGYVLMLRHNIIGERVDINYVKSRPISEYELSLPERNLVYSNGYGRVYYTRGSTVNQSRSAGG